VKTNDTRDIQVLKDFVQKNGKDKKRKNSLESDEQYEVSDDEENEAKKGLRKRGRPSKQSKTSK